MLYYFFSLLTAAVILLFNNYKSETNRWAAFFLVCASTGGLTVYLADSGNGTLSGIVQFANLILTPYGVIVFAMVYSDRCPRPAARTRFKWLLLIPVAAMCFVTPVTPVLQIDYRLLLAWTAPYYLVACYWLVESLWKEEDRRRKRNRFVVAMIMVPTLLAVVALIYLAQVISPDFDYFRYLSLFIVYSLSVAVLFTFLYGVLGVKLRFERDPLESTMQAVSSGTGLLNHTIKNEIGKIAVSSENLKRTLMGNDENAKQHLQIISNASEHMMAMVSRIHSQMKDIALQEKPVRLDELADGCIRGLEPFMQSVGVSATTGYSVRPTVICDPVHIREALGNIIRNAVEAMPGGGQLEVRIDTAKRGGFRLSVRDNGSGIPAERAAQIFEPFYSTKNGKDNFGLGLSYVYNVMRKCGGSVEVVSREGPGTVVSLLFPRRKLADARQEESR